FGGWRPNGEGDIHLLTSYTPPSPEAERVFRALLLDQARALEAAARAYRARAQAQEEENAA
ncbi:MAG: hypothetical protein ACP5NB_12870, partial [Chloroflexia bacterium]